MSQLGNRNIVDIRFCCMTAVLGSKEPRHPQLVMKELGILYHNSAPKSVWDQWWFFDCQRIPDPLPKYLKVFDRDNQEHKRHFPELLSRDM